MTPNIPAPAYVFGLPPCVRRSRQRCRNGILERRDRIANDENRGGKIEELSFEPGWEGISERRVLIPCHGPRWRETKPSQAESESSTYIATHQSFHPLLTTTTSLPLLQLIPTPAVSVIDDISSTLGAPCDIPSVNLGHT